ncbi:hypothetical protein Droror1_Dr00025963 [Drosera rotundifolia]
MMKQSKGGSYACVLMLIFGLSLISSDHTSGVEATPGMRSIKYVVQSPSVRDLCTQGMFNTRVCEGKTTDEQGRILIDVNDYPGPGPNPGHQPPPSPSASP